MYAAELAPDTTTTATRTRTTVDTTTDRGTAAVYRQAPDRADVIDAWARHVAASNGFGDATTGDTPPTYVLPYWKSR
jgi:hypothetical protein